MNKIFTALALSLIFSSNCAAESFTAKAYIGKVLGASLSMQKADEALKQAENTHKNAIVDAALPSFTLSLSESFYNENRTAPREPVRGLEPVRFRLRAFPQDKALQAGI